MSTNTAVVLIILMSMIEMLFILFMFKDELKGIEKK